MAVERVLFLFQVDLFLNLRGERFTFDTAGDEAPGRLLPSEPTPSVGSRGEISGGDNPLSNVNKHVLHVHSH